MTKKYGLIIVLFLMLTLTGCSNTKRLTCTATDDTDGTKKFSTLNISIKDKEVKDMKFTVDIIFPAEAQNQRQSYIDEIKRTKPYMEAVLIDNGIRIVTKMEDGSFIGIDAGQEITVTELRELLELQGYTCK